MQQRLVFECSPAFSSESSFHYSLHMRVEFSWYRAHSSLWCVLFAACKPTAFPRTPNHLQRSIFLKTISLLKQFSLLSFPFCFSFPVEFPSLNLQYYISWVPNLLGKKLTITGRNHYHVQVTCGEKIFFKREPDNSNDPNAIIVYTYERDIIGHLTKDDAKFYSRFLNFDTCVFGVLTRSAHGFYKTSMLVEKIMESPKYAVFNQWMFYNIFICQIVQYSRNAY